MAKTNSKAFNPKVFKAYRGSLYFTVAVGVLLLVVVVLENIGTAAHYTADSALLGGLIVGGVLMGLLYLAALLSRK